MKSLWWYIKNAFSEQDQQTLSQLFHNFSRYDSHQIFKNLQLNQAKNLRKSKTKETYTSVSMPVPVGSFRDKRNRSVTIIRSDFSFHDSLQFMPQSLDSSAKCCSLISFTFVATFPFFLYDPTNKPLTMTNELQSKIIRVAKFDVQIL